MSYKVDRDLRRMLRHQDLIESSLSFVSGSEDFIRENDIFPSSQSVEGVMRGLRYPNGTGVVAGVTSIGDVDGYDLEDGQKVPRPAGCSTGASASTTLSSSASPRTASALRRRCTCCSSASCPRPPS